MKIYTKLLVITFSFFYSVSMLAQSSPRIKKKDIKLVVSSDDLKSVMKEIKKGNFYYNQKLPGLYEKAVPYYKEAVKLAEDNAALNYRLGVSLLYSSPKKEALSYLETAYEMDMYVAKDLSYYLGRAYHFNWNFDSANYFYDLYFSSLKKAEKKKINTKIEHLKIQCSNGKELQKNKTKVIITDLGKKLNSKYNDYNPIFSADETEMYFTSRRPFGDKPIRNALDGRYNEDIYVSFIDTTGQFSEGYRVGKPLNTDNDDAAISLSLDGQTIYLYRGNKDFGALYKSELKGTDWKNPSLLSSRFNSNYHETSLCYSFDGKTMFFVSDDAQNTIGGKDIFYSKFNGKKWSKPKNLGPIINTIYDEESVYFSPDNKTLYFSSKGHNSIGGYDVFKTEMQGNGNWSAPQNLGIPVNTPYDDLFFKPSLNGRFAYYSSINDSVNYGGLDMYEVYFFVPKPLIQSNEDNLIASQANPIQEAMIEKTVAIKTIRLTIVQGTVTSSTGENVEADVDITNLGTNTLVSQIKSNISSGKYIVTLLPGNNYSMNVKAKGYLFYSENFNISDTAKYQKVKKDIVLQKVAIGAKVVLKNVFFDTGKTDLTPESYDELENLITFMNENPTVKIEIGGHTDNVGSFSSNKKLSQARAQSVVDYLLMKGVSPDRLEAKGYSSTKPIANNKTKEGRAQNRRVEARIFGY